MHHSLKDIDPVKFANLMVTVVVMVMLPCFTKHWVEASVKFAL